MEFFQLLSADNGNNQSNHSLCHQGKLGNFIDVTFLHDTKVSTKLFLSKDWNTFTRNNIRNALMFVLDRVLIHMVLNFELQKTAQELNKK
jgi:hypothetical protein